MRRIQGLRVMSDFLTPERLRNFHRQNLRIYVCLGFLGPSSAMFSTCTYVVGTQNPEDAQASRMNHRGYVVNSGFKRRYAADWTLIGVRKTYRDIYLAVVSEELLESTVSRTKKEPSVRKLFELALQDGENNPFIRTEMGKYDLERLVLHGDEEEGHYQGGEICSDASSLPLQDRSRS